VRLAIQVRGIVWVGTRTDAFDESVRFFRDLLGIPLAQPDADFAWARMPDGSQLEVFGPSDHDHTDFSTGPVPEFLVDDLAAALVELREAGVEILGEPVLRDDEGWLHFRAPDGNVYGLTSGPQYRRDARA
jgi:predicted enzyme related to lactoylglutathione lyase